MRAAESTVIERGFEKMSPQLSILRAALGDSPESLNAEGVQASLTDVDLAREGDNHAIQLITTFKAGLSLSSQIALP